MCCIGQIGFQAGATLHALRDRSALSSLREEEVPAPLVGVLVDDEHNDSDLANRLMALNDLKSNGELVVGTRNYAFDSVTVAETPGAQIGEYVRVTVRDDGPGLGEEALDRIFDFATTARPSVARAKTAKRLSPSPRLCAV